MGRLLAVWLMVAAMPAWGQMSVSAAMRARGGAVAVVASAAPAEGSLPATVGDALGRMFADADTVFAGEVTAIEAVEGAVEVRLRVDEAVRGAGAGQTVVLREWSGLWADGTARYVVGQRGLFLLRAASVAGFASPVADGVIPLHGEMAGSTADLRWVARHVAVGPEGTGNREQGTGFAVQGARAAVDSAAVDPYAVMDRGLVMDMLRGWQRVAAGAAR